MTGRDAARPPRRPLWIRPVVAGLLGWVVLRTLVAHAPQPDGSPPGPTSLPIALLVAAAAGIVAWADLRRSREVTLLGNLGVPARRPLVWTFALALIAELVLRGLA